MKLWMLPGKTRTRGRYAASRALMYRRILAAAALTTAAALTLGSGIMLAELETAQAATYGAGYNQSATGSVLGNFELPDGSKGYCIDPGAGVPTTATSDGGISTAVTSVGAAGANARTLTAKDLSGINLIVSRHGQTDDNNTAAAVALTVWSIANPAAFAAETAPWGDGYKLTLAPLEQRQPIKTLTAQFRAEAAAYSAPTTVEGAATMHLTTNATDSREGTLTIDTLQAPGSGTITLTNGNFVATNSPTIAGTFTAGETFAILGIRSPDSASYRVTATLTATSATSAMPAPDVHLWVTGDKQKLVSNGSTVTTSMTATASDEYPRTSTFQPIATTQAVSVWMHEGADLIDTIQPAASPGLNTAWPQLANGAFVAVTYKNVAYGPYDTIPAASAQVPRNAPIAATAHITTTAAGPTTSYTTTMKKAARKSGYYTFVVSVDYAEQNATTQTFLPGPQSLPAAAGYHWSDKFGIQNETGFTFAPVTTLAQPLTSPLGTVTDSVTIAAPIPAQGLDVTFAGYLQPPGSTAPLCDATTLAYSSAAPTRVSAAGTYESEKFAVPAGGSGTIYWVAGAVVHGTSVVASLGVCGETGEQSIIAQPTVATTAPVSVIAGATTHDVVTVTGWVAASTTTLVTLYKQGANDSVLSCTDANRVSVLPVIALTTGLNTATTYTSAETGKLAAGHYGFVQQTMDRNGAVISTGGCQDELFTVPAALATTGSGDQWVGLGVIGALLALAGMVIVGAGYRRRLN